MGIETKNGLFMLVKNLVQRLIRSILLEDYEHTSITPKNLMDLYQKLVPVVHDENNLKQGLYFARDNFKDYGQDDFVTDTINSFINDLNGYITEKRPNFFDQFDRGYSGNKFVGSAYDRIKGLPIKEVAKLVREELRILYPDWKFSIRTDHNSMNVDIVDIPYDPYSEEYGAALNADQDFRADQHHQLYNDQYNKDREKIKGVVSQYNMNDSDGMRDYHHSHFYSSIDLVDRNVKRKWYSQNAEFKRMEKWHADYDAKIAKANAEAAARRGKYKRGTAIIYTYKNPSAVIPPGEYEGVVLKSPNGQGALARYNIRFLVTKKYEADRTVVDRDKPLAYTTSTPEENIRPM